MAALAFGLLPISPASAAITVDDACGSFIEEDGFTDTGTEDVDNEPNDVEDAVDCLLAYGITSGKTATTFGTGDIVTRGQLATFVMNILDQVDGFMRPASAADAFPDDETSVHEQNINDAAALGLIQGFNDGTFRPGMGVTRAQMATFIVNTLEEAGITVPAGDDAFTDDDDSVHEDNINSLEQLDIVDGTVTGDYDPEREVTRGTMAFFLVRTLEVLVDAGLVQPVGTTSNQTFTATPGADQIGATGTAVDFTVTGITSATVDIALVPCENVTRTGEMISFADADGTNGAGDDMADLGSTAATLTTVNGGDPGTDSGDSPQLQSAVTAVNGAVTFSVNNNEADCIVAVVFDDADDDNAIDLNADNQPTEAFAVSGQVTFAFGPAANQSPLNENVVSNDEAANQFTGCEITTGTAGAGDEVAGTTGTECFVFSYDTNDRFFRNSAADPLNQLTMAEFEALLTAGDDIGGTYLANAEFTSEFVLFDESPTAPTVTVAATTGAESTSVTLTITGTSSADTFEVFQATGDCGMVDFTTAGQFTQVGTVTNTVASTETFVVSGLSPSTAFCFVVTTTDDGQQSGPSGETAVTTAATDQTDQTAPTATDTRLTSDVGFAGVLDSGDVFKVVFNETMAAPEAGDTLRVRDTDATVADIVNGANATFTVNTAAETVGGTSQAAGTVLTVTLTAQPTIVDAGTSAGVQIPADIVNSLGITDAAGNRLVLTSGDVTIDVEVTDSTAPTFSSSAPTTGATDVSTTGNLSATFSETVASTSTATLSCDGANVTGTTTFGGSTITFDPTADLANSSSCTATFTARDAAGNVSTPTDVTFTTVAAAAGDTTAPLATDAGFADEGTDLDSVFGDEAGDTIILALDEVVAVADGDIVVVDGIALTCGTNVLCTANTQTSPLVFTSTTATPAIVITVGTSNVNDTTGIADAAGNEVAGLPELID